jgi:hypothetical protein
VDLARSLLMTGLSLVTPFGAGNAGVFGRPPRHSFRLETPERQAVMRTPILVVVSLLSILGSACGAADPSVPQGSSDPNIVVRPRLSLALDVVALGVGKSSTGTVVLDNPAEAGGTVITLSSSDVSAIGLPPTITVLAGDDEATFAFKNSYGGQSKSVTITAFHDNDSAERSLFIPSLPPEPAPCKGHACQP